MVKVERADYERDCKDEISRRLVGILEDLYGKNGSRAGMIYHGNHIVLSFATSVAPIDIYPRDREIHVYNVCSRGIGEQVAQAFEDDGVAEYTVLNYFD